MQMRLDWDLDPGSMAEVTPCLQLDHLDHLLSEADAELFVNLGCSPPPLPNDDIWKKFDDFDDLDDLDEILKDVASLGWMGQQCDLQPAGKDAREIRNHDCMWAGHCVSEKHDKMHRARHMLPVWREPERPKVVAVTTPSGTVTTDGSVRVKKAVVAPTNARSLLLPARVVRSKPLDSGGESPRPETPLSLSEDEDFAGLAGIADDELDHYLEASDEEECRSQVQVSPSKVTGQTTVRPEPVTIERHYTAVGSFSDHCYHLSKTARMDHLGVQTPSDSEEEIDVETVCGEAGKKPHSRSSSSGGGCGGGTLPGGGLPTNPSPLDRHQLQLTVASAISKKDAKRHSVRAAPAPNRYVLDDRTDRPVSKVRRTVGGKKRGAPSEDRECGGRKRKQQRHHLKTKRGKTRRSATAARHSSSDSELDSTEKRSLHNNMERQRRVDLRNAFEELRMLIPDTADNQRAPKVLILSHGADYCFSLAQEEADLTRRRAELRRQQEMLRARVSQLRRSLAARR